MDVLWEAPEALEGTPSGHSLILLLHKGVGDFSLSQEAAATVVLNVNRLVESGIRAILISTTFRHSFGHFEKKTQAEKKLKQILEKLKQIIQKLNKLPTKN